MARLVALATLLSGAKGVAPGDAPTSQPALDVIARIHALETACRNDDVALRDSNMVTGGWKDLFQQERNRLDQKAKQPWAVADSDLHRLRRKEKQTWHYHSKITEDDYRHKAREADEYARKMSERVYDLTHDQNLRSEAEDATNKVQDTCEDQARTVQDTLQEDGEKARKELEKWYDDTRQDVRNARKQWIHSQNFDCKAEVSNMAFGWTDEKKRWCCATDSIGCETDYDCNDGLDTCSAGWSVFKKDHCADRGQPCEDGIWDCDAWHVADWVAEKTSFCCKAQNKGCQEQQAAEEWNLNAAAAPTATASSTGLAAFGVGVGAVAAIAYTALYISDRRKVAAPEALLG